MEGVKVEELSNRHIENKIAHFLVINKKLYDGLKIEQSK